MGDIKQEIRLLLADAADAKQQMLEDEALQQQVEAATELFIVTYRNGGKILFCGNGGSAADAQHLAAELTGRFYLDRKPLRAEALHTNSSLLTAVANDYGYDAVYARQVEAHGDAGDVLVAISTSGNSQNVLNAIHAAREQQMKVVVLTGKDGGESKKLGDVVIAAPATATPRIQECHILIGHIICQLTEAALFGS